MVVEQIKYDIVSLTENDLLLVIGLHICQLWRGSIGL